MRKCKLEIVDVILSRAIKSVLTVSLSVHLLLLISSSNSVTTSGWLGEITFTQNVEGVPIFSSWGLFNGSSNVNWTWNNNSNDIIIFPTASAELHPPQILPVSFADIRAPHITTRIPLDELVHSNGNVTCDPGKSGKRIIHDVILPENITHTRQIPKIIHVTSKTRCMTPPFLDNLDKWRHLPDHSFYFHDDVAVDRLLAKYWPEFPQLQLLLKCTVSGAAKADIWRLLILWEYGGIYTDIDNAPGVLFDNGNIIKDDDDSWFVVEQLGILSQYFMAASPKHPLIHIALFHLFQRLLDVDNIRKQYVPYVTGPGTIKSAMMIFRKDMTNEKVTKGKYWGIQNRSVTVKGEKGHSNDYVKRESVSGIHKKGGYTAMRMTHFSQSHQSAPKDSCYEYLYKQVKQMQSVPTRQNATFF